MMLRLQQPFLQKEATLSFNALVPNSRWKLHSGYTHALSGLQTNDSARDAYGSALI